MNQLKIGLLAVVIVLLIIQVADGVQRSRQSKAMHDQLRAVQDAVQAGVRLAPGQQVTTGQQASHQGSALPAGFLPMAFPEQRDGKHKLGVNFLLPYDRSHLDPAKVGGTLRVFQETPKSLNYLLCNMASTGAANGLVNDSLCDNRPEHPELWYESLATQAVIFDDYTTFLFTLRPGVFWHRPALLQDAGNRTKYVWLDQDVPLTAHDFVFTLDIINHSETKAGTSKAYYKEAKAYALNDQTLLVRWKTREYSNISFSLGLRPLPRHIYGHQDDGAPIPAERLGISFNQHWFDAAHQLIGVGGYRLEHFVTDKEIVFVRNPSYWGAPLHFDRIVWDGEVKDPSAQLVEFKNGRVHVLGLPPDQYKSQILDRQEPRFPACDPADPKAGRQGDLAWEKIMSNSFGGMVWNLTRPQLKELPVRRALAHAYPKERIIKDVYVGLARPQVGPVHPDYPSANKDLKEFAFDLTLAGRLLDEAGWKDSDGDGWRDKTVDGKKATLRLETVSHLRNTTGTSMLNVYRDCLRQVGVEMVLVPVEGQAWATRSEERNFDAFLIGWQMGDLEDDFKQLWHSSSIADNGSNYASWSNPEADRLIEAHRLEFDFDKRLALSRQFQKVCWEDQPYLFISSGIGILAWQGLGGRPKEHLGGVEYGLDAYHPLFRRERLRWHLIKP